MSGVFWDLLADHYCAQQSDRARIHAVARAEVRGLMRGTDDSAWFRTACGLDARLLAHGAIIPSGSTGDVVIAAWPAPKADRCTDCAAKLNTRGKVAGSHSFQNLVAL